MDTTTDNRAGAKGGYAAAKISRFLGNCEKYVWRPFGRQERVIKCPAFEVLEAGSAGSGKSDDLLISALMSMQWSGANALILRRKFVDLERSLIQRSHVLFKGRGHYDGQHKRWKFAEDRFIEFGHCQTQKDVDNYYSAQYSFIGIDQVEQFLLDQYLFFFSRVRTTNPEIRCKIMSTANPVGVGKNWLAQRFWIKGDDIRPPNKAYVVKEEIILPDGEKKEFEYYRAYIPSLVFDNPYIMKNDPQYLMRLSQLPESKRKALMYGDWNAFEGAFFMEWNERTHVCEPFDIPLNWKRSISFDWGYSDPTCIGWFAENPHTGQIYLYREVKIDHTLDIDVARLIAERSEGEDIYCIFYPWDLDFKNPQTGISMKERMEDTWRDMGKRYYLKVANKDRLNGWSAVRHLLSLREDKKPRMQVFKTCKYIVDSFPIQVHDSNNSEDLDTLGDDHGVDCVRYYAATYRGFYEKKTYELGADPKVLAQEARKNPIDVGGAYKMPNGEYRMKIEREGNPKFNWMVE